MQYNNNQIANMLRMIDPEHGIVIDDNIGLLGEFSSKEIEEENKKAMIREGFTEKCIHDIGIFNVISTMSKRGQYFIVVDSDGCVIIDEFIEQTFLMYKNNSLVGYAFILKEYKAKQILDIFFDDESSCPAVILFIDNKLYINNVNDSKLIKKYNYSKDISISVIGTGTYKINYKGDSYSTYIVDNYNKIGYGKAVKLNM